jgi:hypothetical protein
MPSGGMQPPIKPWLAVGIGLATGAVLFAVGFEPLQSPVKLSLSVGMTPHGWLQASRLDRAKELLKHSTVSLAGDGRDPRRVAPRAAKLRSFALGVPPNVSNGSIASFRARSRHDRFTPMNGHIQR